MRKLNAGEKATHVLKHEEVVHEYPNQHYSHHNDPEKTEMARKGKFGTKEQLHSHLEKVQNKFPSVLLTHRHNSTVR